MRHALVIAMALAGALLAWPAASEAKADPKSLVIVELLEEPHFVGTPPGCTDGPDAICMAAVFETRIRIVRELAGPPVDASVPARFIVPHNSFHVGQRLLVATDFFAGKDGPLNVLWWRLKPGADGNFCVTNYDLEATSDQPGYELARRSFPDKDERGFRCIKG